MARFKIVPDPDHIGIWNVYEGWWIFRTIWREAVDCGGFNGTVFKNSTYASVEDAKDAIDQSFAYNLKAKKEKTKIKEWRKTPAVDYP